MATIAEYDRLGSSEFLHLYGYGAATTYFMNWNGRRYDTKAIVGVAYGKQFPDDGPLASNAFSGGKNAAGRHLSRLGFDVDDISRGPDDWSLEEVEIVVAEYFSAYAAEQQSAYVRRQFIEDTIAKVGARNGSAVERKISNICAILKLMGLPYLKGFGALGNKQTLLTAVVVDWLSDHPDVFDTISAAEFSSPEGYEVEVPAPVAPSLNHVQRERKICKVDFAERDARNRALGLRGEAWAVNVLKAELAAKGRPDLAERVEWVSQTIGDGLGYDIGSFDLEGNPVAVEVKTTTSGIYSPFLVTENEIAVSLGTVNYVIMRIFDFGSQPKFYRLTGSIGSNCQLQAKVYSATPRIDII